MQYKWTELYMHNNFIRKVNEKARLFFTKNIVVLQRLLIRKLVASYSWSWRKKEKKALISYFCSCCCDLDNLNPSVCVQYPVSIIKKENQEGIQQLRGPNLTLFWPPTPLSGQSRTFYLIPILYLRDQVWTFYWPTYPPLLLHVVKERPQGPKWELVEGQHFSVQRCCSGRC